jgi:hypothetical protein
VRSSGTEADRPRAWRGAVAAGLLLAAIGATLVLRRAPIEGDAAAASAPAALERYGFVLEDVAGAAGIDFRHAAPELDARLAPIMPLIAATGASVSITDYDRDGRVDIYTTTSAIGGRNALYRNLGDGRFEDVAGALGIADVNAPGTGVSMGGVWGDYDNDGDEDLFLYKWGRQELFRNEGVGGFVRASDALDLPARVNAGTAIWLDYDRDGWLDLLVGGFYPADVDLWNLHTTRFLPESFEYAHNGGRNYLLHNRGDGAFEDVADALGLTSTRWTLAAAAGDVDGDGWPDLLVANDFGVSELYVNEGGRRFRDVSRVSNIGRVPKSGMNASFGDLLNRGEWALFVSNIAEPGILMHGNDLWLPAGTEDGAPVFRNAATALGVDLGGWTYGAQFADLNNDGWLDLVVVNGFVSGEDRQSYWYDYSKVATGHRSIIADADNWPALAGRSLSGYQRDLFHVNDGAGGLVDASAAVVADSGFDGRGVAVADLWNRGMLDVIIANQRGPLQVLRNRVAPGRHWIGFDLRGTRSNRGAVGAELRLFWSGRTQRQQVEGGSGFAAQRDRRLHFGLGAATQVDSAVIRWPSGTRQVLRAPAADTLHVVTEPR